ncbi:uncharacterized protein LOC111297013 isoform X2 [Durio zibethinus]|uniref:Uncharacterized protein LOC111297013 isoform X2 n=1 Tax=Durio zibethinus TaxID=66656 RepID=A0A6P5Z3W8_DURZI|nr:uncharacterized protein LOC111297013 isoform X2 [Durio zibethinus]
MQVLHHLVPKCKTSLKDRMQMQDKDVELLPYNLVSLNEASINVHNWIDGKQECGQCLGKLLCGLNKVKSLKLSNEALESLLFAESNQGHLPTFNNLSMLNASVSGPYIDDNHASGALMYLLQKS